MGWSQGAPWRLRDTYAMQTALTGSQGGFIYWGEGRERREKGRTEGPPYGKERYRDAERQRKETERKRQREMGEGWVEGKREKRKRNKREKAGRVQPSKGRGGAHVHKDHTTGQGTAHWGYAF